MIVTICLISLVGAISLSTMMIFIMATPILNKLLKMEKRNQKVPEEFAGKQPMKDPFDKSLKSVRSTKSNPREDNGTSSIEVEAFALTPTVEATEVSHLSRRLMTLPPNFVRFSDRTGEKMTILRSTISLIHADLNFRRATTVRQYLCAQLPGSIGDIP